jgi:hypothetical protein
MPAEWPVELDAHFQVDLIIQVNRNMAAGTRDLLRANYIPDGTTGVRYHFRELLRSCATAYDRNRASAEPFDLDNVFHEYYLGLSTWD